MDMKYKIVISIFIIVILFYFAQFVVNYMTSVKKRESFTDQHYDDIEHYEDKPKSKFNDNKPNAPAATVTPTVTPTSKPDTTPATPPTTTAPASTTDATSPTVSADNMDLRLLILDEIQTVEDKNAKGALLEYLFSNPILKDLNTMSNADQIAFIKKAISSELDKTSAVTAPSPVVINHDNTSETKPVVAKQQFIPQIKDYYENNTTNLSNQISTKLDGVLNNLNNMKDGLSDIKSLFNNKGPKEPYIPSIPDLPIANVETFVNNNDNLKKTNNDISGFENIKSWGATY